MAIKHQLNGECFEDVNDAIQSFREKAEQDDLILVCGSIFVVGEVDRKRFLTN
jgi:dihydrofolate synthase/folylpolyglutamate synthase